MEDKKEPSNASLQKHKSLNTLATSPVMKLVPKRRCYESTSPRDALQRLLLAVAHSVFPTEIQPMEERCCDTESAIEEADRWDVLERQASAAPSAKRSL